MSFYDDQDTLLKRVEHDYDLWNRWIEKRVDEDGDTIVDRTEQYVYDEQGKYDPASATMLYELAARFEDGSLANRYLSGPEIDQTLADENVDLDEVFWLLGDNQNTTRDIATYDETLDSATVVNHIEYDSFGEITCQTDDDFQPLQTFQGRILDEDTGLIYFRARWFDPIVRQFIGQDPKGFTAGDTNLARIVGNGPTNATDPSGMEPKVVTQIIAALAKGDVQAAMQLLGGIGFKGAHLVPRFIEVFQRGTKLSDGQCQHLARQTFDLFVKVQEKPQIIKIVDRFGSAFWNYKGELVTNKGFHWVVVNGGKVYDKITGPNGMAKDAYFKMLSQELRIAPVLEVICE